MDPIEDLQQRVKKLHQKGDKFITIELDLFTALLDSFVNVTDHIMEVAEEITELRNSDVT